MGQSASLGGGPPRTGKMGKTIQTAPPLPLQLPSTMGDGVLSGVGGVHSGGESLGQAYRGKRCAARALKIRPASPSRRPHKNSDGLSVLSRKPPPDRKLHPLNRKDFSKSWLVPMESLSTFPELSVKCKLCGPGEGPEAPRGC